MRASLKKIRNKQSDVYSEILSLQQATRDLGAKFQVALDRMRQDVLGQLSRIREASVQEQIQRVLRDLGQLTLEHPIGLDTVSAKLDALADSVTQLQRHMKTTTSYQSVLRAVRFERLKFRHERISVAHAETFGWVFEDEASGVHGPLSLHFRKWLRGRDGIFWIRGKAGSGKSTLMKFLCGDERTYDNLAAWATSRQRLVVAKYFFWSAGTPLQRSQEGLFRSLIYDILCQRPECIPIVQKRLVQRQEEIQDCEEIWTWDFTWQTLRELISANSPDKICFFIDGLDEYDGDSENLLQTIKLFEACQRVKVCVSSRPWSEFVHEFGDDDSHLLRVEDLTAQDIRKYADETLSSNSRFKRLSAKDNSIPLLLDEIVSKSSGVFLWVRLVVQSLLQGLKYADSNQFLWKRLRSFPPDLDDFFVQMIRSIPPIYQAKAAITFKTAMVSSSSLPAMVYYFINRVEEDEDFALSCPWEVMPADEIASTIQDTALRLDGWTKGLLEVVHYEAKPDFALSKVEFLHRTVRDFIQESDHVRQLLGRVQTRQLDVSGLICHGSLAFLKHHPRQSSSHIDYDFVMNIFYHAALVADDDWRVKRIHPVLDQVGLCLMERGRAWKGTPTVCTMCEYAAEYGLKAYISEILDDLDPEIAKFERFTPTIKSFYTDLLRRCLRTERTSTEHERPWLSISKTVVYLIDKGADPNNQRIGREHVASTTWNAFLHDFEDRLRHGDQVIFDICCALVSAGAPLDAPFGNSDFLREAKRSFSQDQITELLNASRRIRG